MYHVIVFSHLSNSRQWQCSRNKSRGKGFFCCFFFSQTYLQPCWIQTHSDVSFIHRDTVMSPDNTDSHTHTHTHTHTQEYSCIRIKRGPAILAVSRSSVGEWTRREHKAVSSFLTAPPRNAYCISAAAA